jgi:hypothetical protein
MRGSVKPDIVALSDPSPASAVPNDGSLRSGLNTRSTWRRRVAAESPPLMMPRIVRASRMTDRKIPPHPVGPGCSAQLKGERPPKTFQMIANTTNSGADPNVRGSRQGVTKHAFIMP